MTPAETDIFREEGPLVEWKESHTAKDLLDAVCALANDLAGSAQPGFVVVGLDKRGRPAGKYTHGTACDEVQQHLVNLCSSTKLLPHPSLSIEPHEHLGQLVFVIRVEPYPVPPVVKVNGVAWVRVGSVTRRASDVDLRRLEERRPPHLQAFDGRPCTGASLGDLDRPLLEAQHYSARLPDTDPETFHDLERWLSQEDLGRPTAAAWTPNNAAVLIYGLDPQAFFPGAHVDIVHYGGDDYDAPILARKTATGNLPAQLQTVWTFLGALNADLPLPAQGMMARFEPVYPHEVLRELVRNMIQHRDYAATRAPGRIAWFEDRVELSNPGAPFGQANAGAFGDHSDYRNPTLTQHLLKLGYVERAGRGVRKAQALLRKKGLPPLEIETNGHTSVTVRRSR